MSTFCDLMSPWQMGGSAECRNCSPLITSTRISDTTPPLRSRGEKMRSCRLPLSMYSMTSIGFLFVRFTAPIIVVMLGWRRLVSMRISLTRSRVFPSRFPITRYPITPKAPISFDLRLEEGPVDLFSGGPSTWRHPRERSNLKVWSPLPSFSGLCGGFSGPPNKQLPCAAPPWIEPGGPMMPSMTWSRYESRSDRKLLVIFIPFIVSATTVTGRCPARLTATCVPLYLACSTYPHPPRPSTLGGLSSSSSFSEMEHNMLAWAARRRSNAQNTMRATTKTGTRMVGRSIERLTHRPDISTLFQTQLHTPAVSATCITSSHTRGMTETQKGEPGICVLSSHSS
mmetsp:Transcript_68193/g.168491  ORF Transcript_68193/g.168491 Transcript_68193/m.168491 type:complete len:341 (-) Transcript_68193:1984-3006(-)